MTKKESEYLSRRERQIMDIIYRRGEASGAEVRAELPNRPSYSAVRALLRILEERGHLRHDVVGQTYVYRPCRSRHRAAQSAVRRLVRTFFDGSPGKAAAALLENVDTEIPPEQLDRLATLIEKARGEGR